MEQELGFGWAEDGVHKDDYDRCLEIYTKSFDKRENFSMGYRLKYHDGSYRWIRDGAAYFDNYGSFVGYVGSCFEKIPLVWEGI